MLNSWKDTLKSESPERIKPHPIHKWRWNRNERLNDIQKSMRPLREREKHIFLDKAEGTEWWIKAVSWGTPVVNTGNRMNAIRIDIACHVCPLAYFHCLLICMLKTACFARAPRLRKLLAHITRALYSHASCAHVLICMLVCLQVAPLLAFERVENVRFDT